MKRENLFYDVLFPLLFLIPFLVLIGIDVFHLLDFSEIISILLDSFFITFNFVPFQILGIALIIGFLNLIRSVVFEKFHSYELNNTKDAVLLFLDSFSSLMAFNILLFISHHLSVSADGLAQSVLGYLLFIFIFAFGLMWYIIGPEDETGRDSHRREMKKIFES